MKSNHKEYDFVKSIERLKEIIYTSDNSFEEVESIPNRDKLTFTNGYYVTCTAIFVDIRDSSNLPNSHKRPQLAKLYRAYISEAVAIINGISKCKEITIVGDCVSGIIDTPYKSDIDEVFAAGAQLISMLKFLNYYLEKKNIKTVRIGVGISDGRALMVKAGYNGSTINDVVWMGDVVNHACNLGNTADTGGWGTSIMVCSKIYSNLNDHNQSLLSWSSKNNCYIGDIHNIAMNDYFNEHFE